MKAVVGQHGQLNGSPFYSVRLGADAIGDMRSVLRTRANQDRKWFTLVATSDSPDRLRFKLDPTAAFETKAAPLYLRGDLFRISGNVGRSCNITMSSLGAAELSQRLERASKRMRSWVEFRVASRKRDLLEIVPDVDLEKEKSADDPWADFGAKIAGHVLPREDFSDWED